MRIREHLQKPTWLKRQNIQCKTFPSLCCSYHFTKLPPTNPQESSMARVSPRPRPLSLWLIFDTPPTLLGQGRADFRGSWDVQQCIEKQVHYFPPSTVIPHCLSSCFFATRWYKRHGLGDNEPEALGHDQMCFVLHCFGKRCFGKGGMRYIG